MIGILRTIAFAIYLPRVEALARGFNWEGTHFGVPVWCQFDEPNGEMGYVATKMPILEIVLTMGALFTQFCNMFRAPGEEFMFAFCIRPIEVAPCSAR